MGDQALLIWFLFRPLSEFRPVCLSAAWFLFDGRDTLMRRVDHPEEYRHELFALDIPKTTSAV
jgi:hypothetical protein